MFRRLAILILTCILILLSLPGGGGAILCFGEGGHLELEPSSSSFTETPRVPSCCGVEQVSVSGEPQDCGDCVDLELKFPRCLTRDSGVELQSQVPVLLAQPFEPHYLIPLGHLPVVPQRSPPRNPDPPSNLSFFQTIRLLI